jgi:hypothetical protein
MYTDEPLVPDPTSFQVQITVEMLKRYKSPSTGQIPAELFQAEGKYYWL